MGLFKRLQTKKETGQYITAAEERFIDASEETKKTSPPKASLSSTD